jgi:signal transduction histidine kinase/CheY-like chemotaxis protein
MDMPIEKTMETNGNKVPAFIRKRLANGIMAVIIITIVAVLGAEIVVRLYFGTKDRTEIMAMYGNELAASVYGSFDYPMSVGNCDSIKRQLSGIRGRIKDVEIFVCDPGQEIVYSTRGETIGGKMADSLEGAARAQTLTGAVLRDGGPARTILDATGRKRYLFIIQPIANREACHHCHGGSRKVLGGMILKMDADRTYSQVAAARNRTILLGIISISAMIGLISIMLNRLIRHPLNSLAEKAKKFAEGDMTVSFNVESENEIGVLASTFNEMVAGISSFSRKLEQEVTRKTTLLNERTRLLALLEKANRDLREVDKLKSTFLANMSHELRTPMNAIIGYTELLADRVDGPINDEQEKSLHKVANNAKHLLQLINDILDISKIESGKTELHPDEVNLKGLIESVLPTFEPMMKLKGISLSLDVADDLPPVYVDQDKVGQILINLLSNAVKFTREGEISITARPSDRAVRPGDPPLFAEVCVEDTGIGIKAEDMPKLFDKFTQLDISTTRQYEGTGLGLSIARGLVVLHKGMVWVESEYGKGSRFCFTLPVKKEMLEKKTEPPTETAMAEGLAEYFNAPVDVFMSEPRYGGKPIKCWEYFHCAQTSCPAFGSRDYRCWLIQGTHSKGTGISSFPEKIEFCKGCETIERLMLEADEQGAISVEEGKGADVTSPKKTVLCIDDNPEAIEIIRKYLGEDYHVVGLLSGENAVKTAKEIRPVAITLDIMMPVKDGWQVLHELKNVPETQDIPVVILSIVDNKQLGFSLGAAEYIVKPVEKTILLRKLKNLGKGRAVRNILIVDNEAETVGMIDAVLREAGYEVMIAYSSEEAITSIRSSVPDLIVLSLTMPEVSGIDVLEYLQTEERVKNIPIIVVTREILNEQEVEQLNGRIRGILNRGALTAEELLNELRNIILRCEAG